MNPRPSQFLWRRLCCLCSLLALSIACEDPAPSAEAPQADQQAADRGAPADQQAPAEDLAAVVDQSPVEGDQLVETDANVDATVDATVDAEMDAEVDMTPVDPVPPILEGDACDPAGAGDECPMNYRCISGSCRYDLRGQVFRMSRGVVNEPAVASAELALAMNFAINSNTLNLLFEPGPYNAEGESYWFIGNGRDEGMGFIFRDTLPIQNFLGKWRAYQPEEEASIEPRWYLSELSEFVLSVPTGIVDTEGGGRFQCMDRFNTTVNIEIWPVMNEGGEGISRLRGRAIGYLNQADIEGIVIDFQGSTVRFIDYFDGAIPEDLDGDGVAAEYPFDLEIEATPIAFIDNPPNEDLSNRSPTPARPQPAECDR